MNRALKITISLALAATLSTAVFAGCSSFSDETVSISAVEENSDNTLYNSSDSSDSTNSGVSSESSGSDSSSSQSSSSEDGGSQGSSASADNGLTYASSGLDINYEVATTYEESHSVAENLLSVITIYSDTTRAYSSVGMGPFTSSTSFTYHDVYTGSGVIFSIEDDYVYFVTCYHVVYNEDEGSVADNIYAYLYGCGDDAEVVDSKTVGSTTYYTEVDYGETVIECEYVGGSWAEDVAVLKAEKDDVLAVNKDVRAVTFSEEYSMGDTAVAIGNYAGAGISVTEGCVSMESEEISLSLGSDTQTFRVMRLDLNIYSGNSGGGLFNENGYYIGMVNAMSTVYSNYSFAIPASIVLKSIENIIYYANYHYMYIADLGVEVDAAGSEYVYNSATDTGAIVERVAATSVTGVAESMGLEVGDIIKTVTIDGVTYGITRTYNIEDLQLIMFDGSVISITYTREGTGYTTDEYTITSSDISWH